MGWQRQVLIWLGAVVVLALALYVLRPILLPFLMGMVVAYFLDPVADWLEERGLPRLAATSIILGVFVLLFIAVLVLLLPVLGRQIANFAENLPQNIGKLVALVDTAGPDWLKEILTDTQADIETSLVDTAKAAAGWIGTLLGSIWSGGVAFINLVSLLVVTPVVAFYMLYDWDRMIAAVDAWLPRDHVNTIRDLARQIDEALAGFVRGQGTVCIILASFYASGLSLAGLNFGVLIGILSGLISFVPYVGSITGFVLAGGVALIQFLPDGNWLSITIVLAIFVVGQFIEGNFLSPKLVGDRVGLHPVWLMFALFAFGLLLGFVGLLLAVPLAAAIGVLLRFALKSYMASPLYVGQHPPPADDDDEK
jgi:predicted PurR-regulated permease PerM